MPRDVQGSPDFARGGGRRARIFKFERENYSDAENYLFGQWLIEAGDDRRFRSRRALQAPDTAKQPLDARAPRAAGFGDPVLATLADIDRA
jgi:hypothetical protein